MRGVRRLPRVVEEAEADRLVGALRTQRDRAIVQVMLLAGLRRCEVLALGLADLRRGEWRVFITDGKGGHERLVPMSTTFFTTVATYLRTERPSDATTDRLFVALKGPTRGGPLSASGFDEVLTAARRRAGLSRGTCHELRHTCFSHLVEDGIDPLFVQQQVGHSHAATTAIYTSVTTDYRNRVLRAALDRAWPSASKERSSNDPPDGLPLASSPAHGHPRHVRHHRPGPAAGQAGVSLSREQVYRLVVGTPERLSLPTLAALCDILSCSLADLIEVVAEPRRLKKVAGAGPTPTPPEGRRPRRARILSDGDR